MDFRQLRYFFAVGEEGSFSRAAQRCFISQSAISHQIAKLEQEVGTSLFDRTTRSVKLTPAGHRLMPIAAEVLALEAKALEVGHEPRESIRITANMSFASQSLDAISSVRERHPNLDVEFVIKDFTDRVNAVASGEADLALIRGEVDRPGLETIHLGIEELVIVTSTQHPLSAFSTVEIGDLAHYPLLLPPRSNQVLLHRVVEEAFVEVGRRVRLGPAIASDHTATLEVLTNPRAWTVLYSGTAAETPRKGLKFMRELNHRLRVPVCGVVRSNTAPNPQLEFLLQALAHSIVPPTDSAS
ncbi:LysR family transcriptional regulator [Rhodococcus sp. Z13]|uniref:LysR family transcriptional regulator n=1 Tax=Rhodococcus sacchari TaxID=2962047 RepID=A0ACD4DFE3_9NOCA|nr:LysR family transcriptional regulator [Rhodococcus sp. Z13]UYP18785.1 LysR family transcriptional regulator [Rhodococcus sp. Z13]